MLKHFQAYARFPTPEEISTSVIAYIAQRLKISADSYSDYDWQGRSISNHRAAIRQLFGFRTATVTDGEEMIAWLKAKILPDERRIESITELVYRRAIDT